MDVDTFITKQQMADLVALFNMESVAHAYSLIKP